ncbi:MAG: hypothetical protein WAQ24_05340 [Candidatus Saccharimonadales bacterium]
MTRIDSYPGATAEQLADRLTNSGVEIMGDFTRASEAGRLHPALVGREIGDLALQHGYDLSPKDAFNAILHAPPRPKNRKGVLYPFLGNQVITVSVSNNTLEPEAQDISGQKCRPGVELVVPPASLTVVSSSNTHLGPREASNIRPEFEPGVGPLQAPKYYVGAAAEFADICAKLPADYSKIMQKFPGVEGPKIIGKMPVTIQRAVLLKLSEITLNGLEPAFDEAVQAGLYGPVAQGHGTFYNALKATLITTLENRQNSLKLFGKLPNAASLIEPVKAGIAQATATLEQLDKYC